jgi:hypothetical protein
MATQDEELQAYWDAVRRKLALFPPLNIEGLEDPMIAARGRTNSISIGGGGQGYGKTVTFSPTGGTFAVTDDLQTHPSLDDIYIFYGVFLTDHNGVDADYVEPSSGSAPDDVAYDWAYNFGLEVTSPYVIPYTYAWDQEAGAKVNLQGILRTGTYDGDDYSNAIDGDSDTYAENTSGGEASTFFNVAGTYTGECGAADGDEWAPHVFATRLEIVFDGTINSIDYRVVNDLAWNGIDEWWEPDNMDDYTIDGGNFPKTSSGKETYTYDKQYDPEDMDNDFCFNDINIKIADGCKIYSVRVY